MIPRSIKTQNAMNQLYFNSGRNTVFLLQPSKAFRLLLMVLFVCLFSNFVSAATYYSRANGSFATPGTWSTSSTGSPTNSTPLLPTDNFIIQSGHTVTIAANATCGNLTIDSGGTLNFIANRTLTVNGTTNVSGTFTLSGSGAKTFTGNVIINNGGVWNETGIAAISYASNLQNDGTYTANTGAHTFSGSGKTISGANAILIPSTTFTGTYTNNGTLTVSTALSGAGTLNNAATGILNIGGTSGITTLNATAVGNIVNYTGAAPQSVKATTYYNLGFSGAGIKTAAGNITVNNDFTLTAGTFRLNNATSYSLLIMGNYVQTGGIFDFNSGTSGLSTMTLLGNLTNTSTSSSSLTTSGLGAPNGNIVFNGVGLQVLNIPTSGAAEWVKYFVNVGSTVKMINNFTLSSANLVTEYIYIGELTVNGTIDCGIYQIAQSGGVAGVAQVTINAGATLITANASGIDGSVSSTNVTRNFNTGANYVFNGTAPQVTSAGLPATINSLTINNTAGVTLGKATTITNNFSIASGAIANLGTFNHTAGTLTLGGATTPSGTWGNTISSATNKNNTYFSAVTGIVNVAAATCTAPTVYAITGASGAFCSALPGSAVGLSSSQSGVDYQLLRGSVAVGSPISGTGSAISFGTFNTTGTYTVFATRTGTLCTATMTGTVNILNYSTPPTPTATAVNVSCPTDATGTITITNPVAPASLAFVSASNQYIDFGTPLLSNRAAFTVEGWVKFDPANYVDRMALFGQNDAIEIAFEAGNLRCWTAGGGTVDMPLSSFPTGNAWNHIAVTGDGTAGGLKIYLNGVLQNSAGSATGSYGSSSDSAKIGYGVMDPVGSGVGLTGEVFKLGFWNRALSATEITNMSSGFVVYDASQSGLLAGYSFNEAIGAAATVSGVGSVAPTGNFVNTPVRNDPFVYSWTSTPPGFTSNAKNLTGLSPRTYNLTTSLKGCTNTGSWVVSSTYTAPAGLSYTVASPSYCVGTAITANSATLTTAGSPAATYAVSPALPAGLTLNTTTGQITGTPTAVVASTAYTVTASNTGGCGTATSVVTITVNPLPTVTVGTITSVTCVSATGSVVLSGLQSGWTISQIGTASGSYTSSGTSYTVTGLAVGNYTFTVNNSGCTSAPTANVPITDASSTTWNGTTWSNGAPDATKNAVITGVVPNSPFTSNLTACALTISTGIVATVASGATLTITNAVTVNGQLIFENNASLVQINPLAVNTGDIEYRRTSAAMKNFDFTYWSSPVAGQTAKNLSPNTLLDKYFRYNPSTGWVFDDGVMTPGVGFIIRVPKPGSPAPDNWSGATYAQPVAFKGVPNNGTYSFVVGANQYNLIGNPYPSALDADLFMTTNSSVIYGALYFWTHNTAIAQSGSQYVYTANDYATYNITGGTGTGTGGAGSGGAAPTRYIGAGQSFFVGNNAAGSFQFTNLMRVTSNNTQFFKQASTRKTATIEKNRVWLNLTNNGGAFKQLLVGYISGATDDWDNLYDGATFDGQTFIDFYSINQGKNLTIQGRALPFESTDEVPLGYRSTIAGTFEVGIDKRDGQLATQEIWLEDKKTNTTHDLTKGKYSFTAINGRENDRFVLKYTNTTLGNDDFYRQENRVLVSIKNKQIKINSFAETIDKVMVYDLLGRKIYQKDKINSNEFLETDFRSSHEVLIVKTTLQNGKVVTDKIVY